MFRTCAGRWTPATAASSTPCAESVTSCASRVESGDSMIKGVPLRVTLVGALVLLSALGLLLSGVAVTSAIEQSLVGRVDEQLEGALRGWANPTGYHPPPG